MTERKANVDLALCAQINFENLAKSVPGLSAHPYYIIAKAQLDEALGGRPVVEVLGDTAKNRPRGGELGNA